MRPILLSFRGSYYLYHDCYLIIQIQLLIGVRASFFCSSQLRHLHQSFAGGFSIFLIIYRRRLVEPDINSLTTYWCSLSFSDTDPWRECIDLHRPSTGRIILAVESLRGFISVVQSVRWCECAIGSGTWRGWECQHVLGPARISGNCGLGLQSGSGTSAIWTLLKRGITQTRSGPQNNSPVWIKVSNKNWLSLVFSPCLEYYLVP